MCIQSLIFILFPKDIYIFFYPVGAASVCACKPPDIKIHTYGCTNIQKLKLLQYQINRMGMLTSV